MTRARRQPRRQNERRRRGGSHQARHLAAHQTRLSQLKDAAVTAPPPEPADPLVLGFVRGVVVSKWAERWSQVMPTQALQLLPIDLHEVDAARDSVDLLLERVSPGHAPTGTASLPKRRHAVFLYEEGIALVVPAEHELAAQKSVTLEEVSLVKLLDHPDHERGWPATEHWQRPEWRPAHARETLELVAAEVGAALFPLPLARHLAKKQHHVVLPVRGGERYTVSPAAAPAEASPASHTISASHTATQPLAGTGIWASWRVERDAPDIQRFIALLRGRTARSSR